MSPFADLKKERSFFLGAFLYFLALYIAIFPDVVFFGSTFAKRDITRYYFPVWQFAVDCMKQGIFPLWNPYSSYGTPFFADIQTCVLYPPTALLYLPDYRWAFNFYILFHGALAGLFTCIWMRDTGASRLAALLSGTAFALSGFVMSAINLTISLCSLVYFPLALLAMRRATRSKEFSWKAICGIVLVFQYLAGDPAVLFATLVVLTVFTLFKTVELSFRARGLIWKPLADLMTILVVFAALGAFHALMFADFLRHSNRAAPTFDTMTMWSMQYSDLVALFSLFTDISMFFMSYWERQSWLENSYAGITVFILALIGLILKRDTRVGYHTMLALLGIGIALGRFCAVYGALYDWFPLFKFIRYPARFLFLFNFAMACLAGFGLDALSDRLRQKKGPWLGAVSARVVSIVVVIGTFFVLATMVLSPWILGSLAEKGHPWMERFTRHEWTMEQMMDLLAPQLANVKRTTVLTLLTLIGILIAARFKPRKMIMALFFFFLVFTDLVESNVTEIRLSGASLTSVGENAQVLLRDKGHFRAQESPSASRYVIQPSETVRSLEDVVRLLKELLTPNLLLPLRISYIAGYDSLFLKDSLELNGRGKNIVRPSEYRYLDMLNIKYTAATKKIADPTYRLLHYAEPCYLYENERVLPRAYLVPEARVGGSHAEVLDKVTSKDFDPGRWIYLEEEPPKKISGETRPVPADDRVDITHFGPNEVRMTVRSSVPQWLFFSDMHYGGWRAFLDDKEEKIWRANFAFRAIPVPSGVSTIRWKYDPILFKIGVGVSLLTAFALGVYFVRKTVVR